MTASIMGPNPAFLTLPLSLHNFQGVKGPLAGPGRETLVMQEQCLGHAGKFKDLFTEPGRTLGSPKSSCFDSSPHVEIKSHSDSIKKYKIPPQEMNTSLLPIYIGFRFLLPPTHFLLFM